MIFQQWLERQHIWDHCGDYSSRRASRVQEETWGFIPETTEDTGMGKGWERCVSKRACISCIHTIKSHRITSSFCIVLSRLCSFCSRAVPICKSRSRPTKSEWQETTTIFVVSILIGEATNREFENRRANCTCRATYNTFMIECCWVIIDMQWWTNHY